MAEDGIHVYNRDGHHVSGDAFELYRWLGVAADGAHAFYLGAELMKAQIALELGKRYVQDEPLDWGVAVSRPERQRALHRAPGATLDRSRRAPKGRAE